MTLLINEGFTNLTAWTKFEGGSNSISTSGGVLTVSSSTTNSWKVSTPAISVINSRITHKIHIGASGSSQFPAILARADGTTNAQSLMGRINGSGSLIEVFKRISSVSTVMASTAFTPSANTDYWVELVTIANNVTFSVYASDPGAAGGAPSPLATTTWAITVAGDITALGAAVTGAVGLRNAGGAASNCTIDDYKVDDLAAVAVAGTIAATSTLTGAATDTAALAGTITATSSLSGDLTDQVPLAATAAATSTLTAALTVTDNLIGTVSATSTLTGNLTNTGTVHLTGTITASTTITGTAAANKPLAASIAATSTLTGEITLTPIIPLAGQIDIASTAASTLTSTEPLGPVTPALRRYAIHWFWEPGRYSEQPDPPKTCPECGSNVVLMSLDGEVFTRHYATGATDTNGTLILEDCPYIATINDSNYAQPLAADIQAGYVLAAPV